MISHFCKLVVFWIVLTLELSAPLYAQEGWIQFDSVTFAKRFTNARILDRGKLNLYSYRDMDGSFNELQYADRPISVAGAVLLELIDSPVDYYFIQFNGMFEGVKTVNGFELKIKEWFADDEDLLQYIRVKNIKQEYLPYLVRMYNGHAPRPFDQDFDKKSIVFIADGFTDERDGQQYDIINVYDVKWLAENLRYCPWETCNQEYPNGVYYNWKAATEVCPSGWRLPDETDWKTLFLGYGLPLDKINKFRFDKDSTFGKKMLLDSAKPEGFNAIQMNAWASFWSAAENSSSSAYIVEISQSNKNRVTTMTYKKSKYSSVRCVK